MPFTPAHPAIILPFIKWRHFSATGLIIGSLSPDFEYFFKMSVNSLYSHSKAGLFFFDLPVTIVLSILFHHVVKVNFIGNLPAFLQMRFQETLRLNFFHYLRRNWWIFLYSALIGTASHIVWDSFTHNGRFFTRYFSNIYQSTYVFFDGVDYPLFYVLQHISTAVGLLIVFLHVVFKNVDQADVLMKPRISYWLGVLAIAIVVLRVRFYVYPFDYDLGNVVVSSITGLMIGVVVCGFINFKNSRNYQKA
jgi:hypothetical protein